MYKIEFKIVNIILVMEFLFVLEYKEGKFFFGLVIVFVYLEDEFDDVWFQFVKEILFLVLDVVLGLEVVIRKKIKFVVGVIIKGLVKNKYIKEVKVVFVDDKLFVNNVVVWYNVFYV